VKIARVAAFPLRIPRGLAPSLRRSSTAVRCSAAVGLPQLLPLLGPPLSPTPSPGQFRYSGCRPCASGYNGMV